MSHATVFLIIDAGRADYVRPERMPFLSGLARQGAHGSFESPPGFAQRTVFFTGRYPDTSNNFSAFVFEPEKSPFKWVRRLGPLGNLVKPYKVMFPARVMIRKITKWTTDAYHTDPAWIPPRYLPFFRPCEDLVPLFEPGALGATSVFDLARAHGLSVRYMAHPVSGDDDWIHAELTRRLRAGDPTDLYVAQLSVLDQQGHIHGPHSREIQERRLRELDGRIAQVHAALEAGYDTWDLFVVGDHGMGPVRERLNVLAALKRANARPGKDYVVFVNSTIAVLWYLTERGRREVEAVLERLPGTHLVDEAERHRRRIPRDRRWGDRMLAADPGVLFWPDYFHVADSTIRGMHGYLDKSEETYSMGILASTRLGVAPQEIGLRSLVDVFPTLCDLMGVPTPEGHEGRSLLSGPTAPVPVPVQPRRVAGP